ncbi:MAG: WbqC family protein [Bacteroidota bacterium]
MTLGLLFPSFAPDLYDIATLKKADTVILQDSEQWSRKSRVHRAKIRKVKGTQWINIPIRTEDKKKAIGEVRIDHSEDWIDPILRALRYNYNNSVYFDFYEPEFEADFREAEQFDYLLPFIIRLRGRLFRYMEFELVAEILWSSDLGDRYDSDPDQTAQHFGADRLIMEHGARHYQRQPVTTPVMDALPEHPEYRQHFEGFEPECCVLDVLFQYGPESFRVLDGL